MESSKLLTLYQIGGQNLVETFVYIGQNVLNSILCAAQLKLGKIILDSIFILFFYVIGIKVYEFPGFNVNKSFRTVVEIKIYFPFFYQKYGKVSLRAYYTLNAEGPEKVFPAPYRFETYP